MNKVQLSEHIRENFKASSVGLSRRSPVFGVGINDADYNTHPTVNGTSIRCPAYCAWRQMLHRAFYKKCHDRQPTYAVVTVCKDWLSFMNFRCWWVENYIDGYQLDKDILIYGNKEYSPDSSIYIPSWINSFINDHGDTAGGARFHKCTGKYQARCSHPITKEREYLGLHEDMSSANSAWLLRKLEIAKELKSAMDFVDLRLYECVVAYVMNRTSESGPLPTWLQ